MSAIHTFDDLRSDEEEDDKKQRYYGGGASSGIQVEAPPSEADRLIERAHRLGAIETQSLATEPSSSAASSAFEGGAHRLGAGASGVQPPQEKKVVVILYKNGFFVEQNSEQGSFRPFSDPANKEVYNAIMRGVAPREFLDFPQQTLKLAMRNRGTQVYEPPAEEVSKPAEVVAFAGHANALGKRASASAAAPKAGTASSSSPSASATAASAASSLPPFSVNPALPTTNIQFRLPDGQKVIGKFNHTHKVVHLRQFLGEQSSLAGVAFSLHTIRPRRELVDPELKLTDGGLLASAIIVKHE